jgi:predicted HNH restriction endonuclease
MTKELEYDQDYLDLCLERAFEDPELYTVPQGITRYDYATTHGWWLRISRDKAQFKEMFYDKSCGSIDEALRRAIRRRHEILVSFPVTIKTRPSSALSGVPDERVHRVISKGRQQPYVAWESHWYDERHRVKKTRFSVKKFGEEEARLLAIEHTKRHHNKKPKFTKVPDNYKKDKVTLMSREDVAVLASVNSAHYGASKSHHHSRTDVALDPHAFEGDRRLAIHRKIERNRKLREAKIQWFLETHGRLHCEICGFSFKEKYEFLARDIIEIHHVVPLANLKKGQVNRLKDLMLLCSNCHFAIHQGDAEKNLEEAIRAFKGIPNKS